MCVYIYIYIYAPINIHTFSWHLDLFDAGVTPRALGPSGQAEASTARPSTRVPEASPGSGSRPLFDLFGSSMRDT